MLREAVCGRAVTIDAYADRYAYTGCGSTAYSVGTVYGGKRDLYTPDARPALLATPRLAGPDKPCLPNSSRNAAYSQQLWHVLGSNQCTSEGSQDPPAVI
jgi:hypothetical protein